MTQANIHREKISREFQWIERIARLMDSNFRIPGTRFHFGWDPILSLIPVAGNALSYVISSILVIQMVRYGASGRVAAIMTFNVILDYLFSSVPVVGTIFDAMYKANNRNIRLLQAHYEEGKYRGSAMPIIFTVVGVLLLILVVLFYLAMRFLSWLLEWLGI
jgi:hypothetical protein